MAKNRRRRLWMAPNGFQIHVPLQNKPMFKFIYEYIIYIVLKLC